MLKTIQEVRKEEQQQNNRKEGKRIIFHNRKTDTRPEQQTRTTAEKENGKENGKIRGKNIFEKILKNHLTSRIDGAIIKAQQNNSKHKQQTNRRKKQ